MPGTLRFLLAVHLVFDHLRLSTANKVGAHAVLGSSRVSVYLMAKTNHGSHGRQPTCVCRFLLNRRRRVFPPCLFLLFIATVLLALFPVHAGLPTICEAGGHERLMVGFHGLALLLAPMMMLRVFSRQVSACRKPA